MATCPACGSSKIRNDYRPAPLIWRLLFVRALLCDHCNRQFKAFSLRSPESRPSGRPKRKADTFVSAATGARIGKLTDIGENNAKKSGEPNDQVKWRNVSTPNNYQHTEITLLGSDTRKVCPECGSSRIRRRPRRTLERMLLSFTGHRAYVCHECQSSFYARASGK